MGGSSKTTALATQACLCTCFFFVVLSGVLGGIASFNWPNSSLTNEDGFGTGNEIPQPVPPVKWVENSTLGMVATDSPVCSRLGRDVIRRGGNAADAAVATALCLGVVHPHSSGLGGGGFAMIFDEGDLEMIDMREEAPMASTVNMMGGDPLKSLLGGLAVGVPGEPKGLHALHSRHGQLSWAEVLAPAEALARNGFVVDAALAGAIAGSSQYILAEPGAAAVFAPNGILKVQGDIVVNPQIADTLAQLALNPNLFYVGEFATSLAAYVVANGGIMTPADLSGYQVNIREPMELYYHGRKVVLPYLPASGGCVASVLMNILEQYNLAKAGPTPESYHYIVEAMKFAYADRSYLGDPDFVPDISTVIATMESKDHAAELRQKILDNEVLPVGDYGGDFFARDDHGTTHFSIMDGSGMTVAMTSTVNTHFGSKLFYRGIFLNNEMDDFSSPNVTNAYGLPPSVANYIAPGKRPLSSSTPLMILDNNDRVVFSAGASGGSMITSNTIFVLINFIDFGMNVREAVDAPRIHHQLYPYSLKIQDDFDEEAMEFLAGVGNELNVVPPTGFAVVQAVAYEEGVYYGASDPRKGGWPAGV